MKLFTISSGFLGLIYCGAGIYYMRFTYNDIFTLFDQLFKWNGFLGYILGMFIASLTLLVAFKPNDPLPWHWILLLFFSILLMIVIHIIAGLPALVAGIMGLINDV